MNNPQVFKSSPYWHQGPCYPCHEKCKKGCWRYFFNCGHGTNAEYTVFGRDICTPTCSPDQPCCTVNKPCSKGYDE
jgi:hypothetical protein